MNASPSKPKPASREKASPFAAECGSKVANGFGGFG
jgi:hypothetical protein